MDDSNPAARLELLRSLAGTGLLRANEGWLLFYSPVDGEPAPPMPDDFPAKWEAMAAPHDDDRCGCDESKALQLELDKLRSELECRTLELQNVETVMGARQKEYRERIATMEIERENTRRCLMAYCESHGFEHDTYSDDGGEEMPCPEDDTCECWYFEPLNAAMRPR